MNGQMLPRHEIWRQQYRNNRYCKHLTDDELNQRFRDVFGNLMRLTPFAQISLPKLDANGERWVVLWTYILEELGVRHGSSFIERSMRALKDDPLPDFVGELGKKAAGVLAARNLNANDVLIKYGNPEHMAAFFERGAMRVQSASFYGQPGHNGAVGDDELSLAISVSLPREQILKVVVNPEDVLETVIDQRMDLSYRSDRDYWLYCVTQSVEPRLFVDFGAAACVIIKNPRALQWRLQGCGAMFPRTIYHEGLATYIDPLLPSTSKIFIPFAKHFRFAYQREFRFVWRPQERLDNLGYVDLKIGSLQDIAELVIL